MEKVRPWCGQPLGQRTAKEQNRILSSVTLETPPPPLKNSHSQILKSWNVDGDTLSALL